MTMSLPLSGSRAGRLLARIAIHRPLIKTVEVKAPTPFLNCRLLPESKQEINNNETTVNSISNCVVHNLFLHLFLSGTHRGRDILGFPPYAYRRSLLVSRHQNQFLWPSCNIIVRVSILELSCS